jgi:hypothetical protein
MCGHDAQSLIAIVDLRAIDSRSRKRAGDIEARCRTSSAALA